MVVARPKSEYKQEMGDVIWWKLLDGKFYGPYAAPFIHKMIANEVTHFTPMIAQPELQSCGNCSSLQMRMEDRNGRPSKVHGTCTLKTLSDNAFIRNVADWCDSWTEKGWHDEV